MVGDVQMDLNARKSPAWQCVAWNRWRREDGAEVWRSDDHFYSNPENPLCRLWEAAGPGPRDFLYQRPRQSSRSRLVGQRKRFASHISAMRAVDAIYPFA